MVGRSAGELEEAARREARDGHPEARRSARAGRRSVRARGGRYSAMRLPQAGAPSAPLAVTAV